MAKIKDNLCIDQIRKRWDALTLAHPGLQQIASFHRYTLQGEMNPLAREAVRLSLSLSFSERSYLATKHIYLLKCSVKHTNFTEHML